MTEKVRFVVDRVEKHVGKGENSIYRHFLLFPTCFSSLLKSNFTLFVTFTFSLANASQFGTTLTFLPRDKISDHSNSKAFADDKINVTEMWVEEMWVEDMWVEDMWVEEMWVEDMWVEEMQVEDMWVEDMWIEDMWVEEMRVEDMWVGDMWKRRKLWLQANCPFPTMF